jgi:hypothetical protein
MHVFLVSGGKKISHSRSLPTFLSILFDFFFFREFFGGLWEVQTQLEEACLPLLRSFTRTKLQMLTQLLFLSGLLWRPLGGSLCSFGLF